jgi:hypothetical protein
VRFRAEDPTPEPADASGCTMPYSMQFLKRLSKSSVPLVEILDSSGSRHHSETHAIDGSNLFESLYIFRNVPAGPATIVVSGRHWQAATSAVEVPAEGVFAPEPVLVELGAELQLTVEVPLISREVECGSSLEGPAAIPEVTLYDCGDSSAGVRPSRGFLSQCTVVVSRRLAEPGAPAEVELSGLAPGEYVLATALGERVTNVERATLEGGRTSIMQTPFASQFVAGRVTRDGRGVPASVRFLTGSAVTDPETGEYYALLSGAPGTAVVHVVGCDESFVYMHRPVTEVPHGPGYDLYLPPNKVLIDVVDDSTGAVLPEASVMVAMVRGDDPTVQIGAVPAFADGDRFRVENLDEGIQVVTCAELSGYKRACSEPMTIRKRTEEVTVRLAPFGKKGIVHGRGYSTVYWVRPDGTISERAPIDDQGEFHYTATHEADHLVLVGAAPLWVTAAPTVPSRQERLELHPPDGVERSIRFRIGEANPRQNATVLLWVNGLPVPIAALSEHQRYRGQPWLIVDRRAMLVSGLFGSDSLAAAEGPDPDTYPGFFDPHAAIFAGRQPHQVAGAEFVFD